MRLNATQKETTHIIPVTPGNSASAEHRRRVLKPRKVISWTHAVDCPDDSSSTLPAVVRWRKAFLGPDGPSSPVTRAILLVLTHYMDKYGVCFPSLATISKASGYSKRTVCEHMKLAVQECWLDVTQAQGHSSGWRRNEYTACIPTFE